MPKKSESPLSPLGAKIESIRVRKNIMLTHLAPRADVRYTQLYRIMHGLSNPSFESLLRICRALGCSHREATEIFASTNFRPPTQDELDELPALVAS